MTLLTVAGLFYVDYISEVEKVQQAHFNLVIDPKKQEIIEAVTHPQSKSWHLDFIQGKGEGQIVLLHGKSQEQITVFECQVLIMFRTSGSWKDIYRW
jgi:hypothetical protein